MQFLVWTRLSLQALVLRFCCGFSLCILFAHVGWQFWCGRVSCRVWLCCLQVRYNYVCTATKYFYIRPGGGGTRKDKQAAGANDVQPAVARVAAAIVVAAAAAAAGMALQVPAAIF